MTVRAGLKAIMVLLLAGIPLSLLTGCGEQEHRKPNVILISIDTLRADHLSCYGYGRLTSPSIDALSRDGELFENAFSTTCWTAPSHMSMFTSLFPSVHKVNEHPIPGRLNDDIRTMTQYLKDAGYHTVGFYYGVYLAPELGFDRGFDVYARKDFIKPALMNVMPLLDDMKGKDKPFFLFMHVGDVHDPYMHPAVKDPEYWDLYDPGYKGFIMDGRHEEAKNIPVSGNVERDTYHLIALYDAAINFTDKYIGRLINSLRRKGLYDNTLIILTADHGEEFGEHGAYGHQQLHRELINVPLIIKLPDSVSGVGKGKSWPQNVSTLDIMPTILDMAGVEVRGPMQGESLLGLMRSGALPQRNIYSEAEIDSAGYRSHRSVLDDGYHYMLDRVPLADGKLSERHRLYDAEKDRYEKANLADVDPSKINKYNKVIEAWDTDIATVQKAVTRTQGHAGPVKLDKEQLEDLKALGYLQ